MSIPVVEPISRAVAHVERICFKPFDFAKWVGLGFCMFLARLGGGGWSLPSNWNANTSDIPQELQQAQMWVRDHLPLVVTLAIAALLVVLAMALLLTWLSSRGQFMVLINTLRNRGDVSATWRESRPLADRLFVFRLLVGLASFVLGAAPVVWGLWHAWPSLEAQVFDARAFVALAGGGCLLLLLVPLFLAFHAVLTFLVVPVMWKRQVGPVEALRILWFDLLPGNLGSLVGFLFMLIPLQLAAGVLTVLGCCLTCCLGMLPVVSSIVFLPLTLFFRCYALEFLAGFGPEWNLFLPEVPEAPALEP